LGTVSTAFAKDWEVKQMIGTSLFEEEIKSAAEFV